MLTIRCPHCDEAFAVEAWEEGCETECPHCSEAVQVPWGASPGDTGETAADTLEKELDQDEELFGLDILSDGALDGNFW